VVAAHDHEGDLPLAGDEEADLAVDLPGDLRDLAGQFVRDDPLRRDAPPVKLADAPDLGWPEAGQVAVDLLDGLSSIPFDRASNGMSAFSGSPSETQAAARPIPVRERA
jgi:hypothetical protein